MNHGRAISLRSRLTLQGSLRVLVIQVSSRVNLFCLVDGLNQDDSMVNCCCLEGGLSG